MASFTGNPNFTASGTGAATRAAADVLDEVVFAGNFTGYDESGTTDSSGAIMAADAEARARNRELVLSGTPRITSTLVINAPTRWRMQGGHFHSGGANRGSHIIKDAGLNGPAIEVTTNAHATILEGVSLAGENGNGDDGFYIHGQGVRLINCAAQGMGGDGCRIGSKTTGSDNSNVWRLNACQFAFNQGNGLTVDDLTAGINANAGIADGVYTYGNDGHGIYVDRAMLGNVFVAPLSESNGGYGIYLGSGATRNLFIGGDVEGNTAGEIYQAIPFSNRLIDVCYPASQLNDRLTNGAFTPRIIGTGTAGTGTYTTRRGFYSICGTLVQFMIELEWTNHTGTGDLYITDLPFTPNTADSNIPEFTPVEVVDYHITLAAGAQMKAGYKRGFHQIILWTSNAGTLTQFPITTSGTLWLRGSFIPNFPT